MQPAGLRAHLGSHSSRATRVSSGFLVSFFTHLSLFEILCTWVSTAGEGERRVQVGQAHLNGESRAKSCL